MPLNTPIHIPPIGGQTDPEQARVAAIVGGQLASAPARGFGLTPAELTAVQALTALSDFGTGAITLTVVTTSGTYTVPAGLRYLEVTVVGGGGGTYSSAVTAAGKTSVAGGGGGAGTAIILYAASALSATETYTVGAAGASTGGVTGTAGGNSTFKSSDWWRRRTGGGGDGGGGYIRHQCRGRRRAMRQAVISIF